MGTPYIGEIRIFAGNFAPAGWEFCAGQLIPISENDALFTLIGTTYGGDGQNTFALPDLRGRVPLHQGNNFVMGEMSGVEEVTLNVSQIPNHTHALLAQNTTANSKNPANGSFAITATDSYKSPDEFPTITTLNAASINPQGGSQPHNNLQPYLVLNFIISMYGIYPTQS